MRTLFAALLAASAAVAGCAPEIGDSCSSSVDCSINGDRICDLASPGGYCTVAHCEMGTCPDDSICVEFRFEPERLASSWCMAPCESNGDCRGGYACVRTRDLIADDGSDLARVLDEGRADARFCGALAD